MIDTASHPALDAVQLNWNFVPSPPNPLAKLRRLRHRIGHRIPAPETQLLRKPHPGPAQWTIYFAYLPEGALTPAHRFAIARLRSPERPLMIVCATPGPGDVPAELADQCDALLWKALPGFDFSAYAAGLYLLARSAPGSDALVINDSVFGPLVDLDPWLSRARWDLTGFTATANGGNHIQSYAFILKNITPERLADLERIFPRDTAYDSFWAVVTNQEAPFARVASRTMSVGSFCYIDAPGLHDPTLQLALPMVRAGFPFLKRSLLGKLSHLHRREDVLDVLTAAGVTDP